MAEKKKKDLAVLKSERLKVEDLLVPRMIDDQVTDPEDTYLHWSALVLLFRDVFPNGAIQTYIIKDDGYYLTMGCKLWSNKDDETPMTECSYRSMYDDDICDTYGTCQSMVLRTALIYSGVGTDVILEDERKRRLEKVITIPEIPANADGMTATVVSNKMASKVVFDKLVDKTKNKKPPEEAPKEEAKDEKPVEETPEEKPKKRRGRPPKKKPDTDEYIIQEEDFTLKSYRDRFAGMSVKDLPESILDIIPDSDVVSDRLKEAIKKA